MTVRRCVPGPTWDSFDKLKHRLHKPLHHHRCGDSKRTLCLSLHWSDLFSNLHSWLVVNQRASEDTSKGKLYGKRGWWLKVNDNGPIENHTCPTKQYLLGKWQRIQRFSIRSKPLRGKRPIISFERSAIQPWIIPWHSTWDFGAYRFAALRAISIALFHGHPEHTESK